MTRMTKYGLRLKETGEILGYTVASNDGADFCTDVGYSLSKWEDNEWLVDDALTAEYVRNFPAEWYNSDYETPSHDFEPDELEVVEVVIERKVNTVDNVSVPTLLEFCRMKYAETEPEHFNYIKRLVEEGREMAPYSLYDLRLLLEEK